MTSHSIQHILAFIDNIQAQIDLPAIKKASRSATSWQSLHDQLLAQVKAALTDIDAALRERDISAGDLAIRSRRAYQWLSFLSDPDALTMHLDALQRVNLYLPGIKGAPRIKNQLRVAFYHQAALYQVRERGDVLEMKIQEGYISAPDMIITALLELALRSPAKGNRQAIKEYSFSSAYREIRRRLEYLGVPQGSFAAGSTHDLRESFNRVNHTYFQGGLDQPNLVWNQRLTHRKFGHYQWDTDTVMLSSTLDHPEVPILVVDYVMYHELLHKKLGARLTEHNRIVHTGEFRKAENKFADLAQAKQLLNRIARARLLSK
jgi:hypothetical protein